MAQNDFVVSDTHGKIVQILQKLEETNALADEATAQWTALGGATAVADYVWPDDLTEAQFTTAISTLVSKPWDLGGGGHDSNLYRVKTAF